MSAVGNGGQYRESAVSEEPDPLVTVLAVGVKERNVVRIGGEEINL
jgi:hypothetical protein